MIELIAFIVFVVFFALLILSNISTRIKNRLLTKEAIQLNIDKFVLFEKLEKLIQEKDNKSLEDSEGFLKFLSQSREWAFSYIEDVQKTIGELMVAIEAKDDIGIEKAFNDLKNFLPNEEENNKNDNKEKHD